MKWLMRLLRLLPADGRVNPQLAVESERSRAVITKAHRVLAEEHRLEVMRGSFLRANRRLGR